MIFFLHRAEPIRLRYSPWESIRAALWTLKKWTGAKHGGALAVQNNLARELQLQKDLFWTSTYAAEPAFPVDIAWVLSSTHDLAYAISLKKKGLIKTLWAGPNLVIVPQEAGGLLSAPEVDACLVPCAWVAALYADQDPALKEKLVIWPVGIDTDYWKNTFNLAKNKLLIYNKNQSELTTYVADIAQASGMQIQVLEYGAYTPAEYRAALSCAWGMIWLSSSETQGLAVLEALSMNVPVLAWNPGRWNYQSPRQQKRFSYDSTSVPYFDSSCGSMFKEMTEFSTALERFSTHRADYHPRDWLLTQHLDLNSNLLRLPLLRAW